MTKYNNERINRYVGKSIQNLKSYNGQNVYSILFSGWHTKLEVSQIINPEVHSSRKERRRKPKTNIYYKKHFSRGALTYISDYINAFFELGWLETDKLENNIYVNKKGVKFRATLKPYLDYSEQKGINIKQYEKYLNRRLEPLRELFQFGTDNFLEFIEKIIKEEIIYSSINEGFERPFKLNFKKNSDFSICVNLAIELYDRFTLKLLQEKIESIETKWSEDLNENQKKGINKALYKIHEKLTEGGLELSKELEQDESFKKYSEINKNFKAFLATQGMIDDEAMKLAIKRGILPKSKKRLIEMARAFEELQKQDIENAERIKNQNGTSRN